MKRLPFLSVVVLFVSFSVRGQGFSSGSTGADGPLDLSTLSCTNCTIQVPASGIFNYTTINIPQGKQLSFIANLRNTPVIMLAQGNVLIAGQILLNGNSFNACTGGTAGIGGFAGGAGCNATDQPGFGPGGGRLDPQEPANRSGKWVGPTSLFPIIGGSGGAAQDGHGAGGGGGAIVIASSLAISVSGTVFADGACAFSPAGHGSGGAIRLLANSITVTGSLFARGCINIGNPGVIRIETPTGSFTGQAFPSPILSTIINPEIVPNNSTPSLSISSIAGFAVPASPAARSDFVDLMLPSQLTDPISVVVQGRNIPIGTLVSMSVGGSSATVTSGTLSGTFDSSSATLNVSGLNRATVSTLFVFATFTPPSGVQAFNPKGPDYVARIRAEATPGNATRFAFIRANGTKVDPTRLSPRFLKIFRP